MSSAMEAPYEMNARPALDLVDQLRRAGVERDIEIHQIAGELPHDLFMQISVLRPQ